MASGCVSCPKCSSDVFFTSVDQLNVPVLSPAVSSLLRTNDCPSASDIHILKESAQYIDDALGDVEADIHRLSDIVSRLKEKRKLFRDAQNTHKIILSPIRRLHPEILVQIFLATYHYLGESGVYNVFDSTSGPWLFGQVCSKWRAIVVSHSNLWSAMQIHASWHDIRTHQTSVIPRHVAGLKGPIPMLSSALSRSGQHALSFKFSCYDHMDKNIASIMTTLFHLLSSHCTRWRNVTLRISVPLVVALSSIGRLPLLTDLELTFLGVGEVPPFHIDAFTIAPRLARAQFINLPEGVHVHFANSNLVHFSDCRSRGAPLNAYLLDIIQTSPDLESFEAAYRGLHAASPSSQVPSTRVVNTSLRTLYACEGVFLGSLVLPALETISITPFSDEDPCFPNALSGLRTLLSQSRCSLTQLEMTGVTPDHHLLPVLELVPTLTSLAFTQNHAWPKYYDDIFQALISRMKATAVDDNGKPYHLHLPQLEKLNFSIMTEAPQDSSFHCFVNHDFAEMVISRWDTDEPSLSSVSVTFVSPLPWKFPGLLPDDITNLKRCQMEKLDIEILSRNFDDEGDFYV